MSYIGCLLFTCSICFIHITYGLHMYIFIVLMCFDALESLQSCTKLSIYCLHMALSRAAPVEISTEMQL